ncbi:hypothetical protein MRB53_015172 [Persea americana]|uniref:Uncharacterized protein n=1 Tax=Persea americana TaxID=3435 RepID=A0ACC2KD06_PERAE|nr:hypothetical protein MRB53_015172 [Persea americana]
MEFPDLRKKLNMYVSVLGGKGNKKKKSSEEATYLEDVAAADDSELEPSSIPKPPVGFILDSNGRVLAASSERIVTIVLYVDSFTDIKKEEFLLMVNVGLLLLASFRSLDGASVSCF